MWLEDPLQSGVHDLHIKTSLNQDGALSTIGYVAVGLLQRPKMLLLR